MSIIKIITFYIGVDVLGFPLIHHHRLVYQEQSSRVMDYPLTPGQSYPYVDRNVKVHKNKNQLKK